MGSRGLGWERTVRAHHLLLPGPSGGQRIPPNRARGLGALAPMPLEADEGPTIRA